MINKDDLRHRFPSMFSKQPKEGVSDRYTFVDTEAVMDAFLDNGFFIERANSVKVRDQKNANHCKHILGFRSLTDFGLSDPRDSTKSMIPEVVVSNSSDAKSAIIITLGLYTMVCSNGLVIGSTYNMLRIPHTNVDLAALEQYIQYFQGNVDVLAKSIHKFASINLTLDQRLEFANKAALVRWGNANKITPTSLLSTRRDSDQGNTSLWATYNIVQENVIRGGLPTVNSRDRHTRAVRSAIKDYDINVKLWNIAEEFSQ